MRLNQIKEVSTKAGLETLLDCAKHAKTLGFRRKLEKALKDIDDFLTVANNPVVSCGGGKDGTAIALLARQINPDIKIICANPPNPLPDRENHLIQLKGYLSGEWHDIDYDWEVAKVLNGEERYPEGLKMQALSEWSRENDIDGVIFGIRAAESNCRKINYKMRGTLYKSKEGWRCQPIATWTAQESLCLALLYDAPINPVYIRMEGIGNLEYLHDGTWWPHGLGNQSGWIKRYYPECLDNYETALKIYDPHISNICAY